MPIVRRKIDRTAFGVRLDVLAAVVWSQDTSWAQCEYFSTRRTRHTHTTGPNFTLPNTDYTHKTSEVISVKHVQYSLRMDSKGSETCWIF